MGYLDIEASNVFMGASGVTGPVVYVIDAPEHPFDLTVIARDRAVTLVSIPVSNWGASLTPWQAPALYRGEDDYRGEAAKTLAELCSKAIPELEASACLTPTARAICGYSLGGLFALYGLTHANAFEACACLSGSVWYEGWVDHLRSLDLDLTGHYAFLSVGTKEKHGPRPIMRTVQVNMEECARILQNKGCSVRYRTGPGNHMSHIPERYAAGIDALEEFLLTQQQEKSHMVH